MKFPTPLFAMTLTLSCGAAQDLLHRAPGDNIKAETSVKIPLLPINLPIFPTALTLDGLQDNLSAAAISGLEDNCSSLACRLAINLSGVESSLQNAIGKQIDPLTKILEDATAGILQPGTLNGVAQQQIEGLKFIEVVSTGVRMKLRNQTAGYAANPAQLNIFVGDGDLTAARDDSAAVPFQAVGEDGQALIKPTGEWTTLQADDAPALTTFFNQFLQGEAANFGIGYSNLYRMVDEANGADTATAADKLWRCVSHYAVKNSGGVLGSLSQFSNELGISADTCPSAKELLGWNVEVESMELDLTLRANLFDVPEIPGCKGFADSIDNPLLKQACGSETEE